MEDVRLQPLPFVAADEEARRFDRMLEAMKGVRENQGASQPVSLIVTEFGRLVALLERLNQRMEVLEAELVPRHRSRKCPCCHRLSLAVVATRPHPELGREGIEQHDVRCSCGYEASRLYDPQDFVR
jgi:hypothetical protein